jgi:hypothetical protein
MAVSGAGTSEQISVSTNRARPRPDATNATVDIGEMGDSPGLFGADQNPRLLPDPRKEEQDAETEQWSRGHAGCGQRGSDTVDPANSCS